MLRFSWDPAKAAANARKHGVTFSEAASVFGDTLSIAGFDPDHSDNEDRYILVGTSLQGRLLLVAYTEHGEKLRIISARKLTRKERKAYENEVKTRKGR
jgi:uncharacterized DUF497 family protein